MAHRPSASRIRRPAIACRPFKHSIAARAPVHAHAAANGMSNIFDTPSTCIEAVYVVVRKDA